MQAKYVDTKKRWYRNDRDKYQWWGYEREKVNSNWKRGCFVLRFEFEKQREWSEAGELGLQQIEITNDEWNICPEILTPEQTGDILTILYAEDLTCSQLRALLSLWKSPQMRD